MPSRTLGFYQPFFKNLNCVRAPVPWYIPPTTAVLTLGNIANTVKAGVISPLTL